MASWSASGLPGDGVPITRVPVGARSFAAFSPDGALAIPTGMSMWLDRIRVTRVYHVATGQAAGPPLHSGVLIIDAVFSPDGRSVATATAHVTINRQTGRSCGSGTGQAARSDGEPHFPPRLEAWHIALTADGLPSFAVEASYSSSTRTRAARLSAGVPTTRRPLNIGSITEKSPSARTANSC